MSLEFSWITFLCSSIQSWNSFWCVSYELTLRCLLGVVRDRWDLMSLLGLIWILCANGKQLKVNWNRIFGSMCVNLIGILAIWRNDWVRFWIKLQQFHTVLGNYQYICSTAVLLQSCCGPFIFLNNRKYTLALNSPYLFASQLCGCCS